MDTKQPEALRREYRATMPPEVLHLWAADALACIASLEAQLEAVGAGGVGPLIACAGFSAADMATASAQGFRDGAAKEQQAGWVNAEDMEALQRADECFGDGVGHDIPKARVDRLLEIGVMRHNGGGYYSLTSFGRLVLGDTHLRTPLETVAECNERLSREHRERIGLAIPSSSTQREVSNG